MTNSITAAFGNPEQNGLTKMNESLNKKDMKYNVDFFINKFEAIPEDLWCTGLYTKGEKHCAVGHCGGNSSVKSEEADFLHDMFRIKLILFIVDVNDGLCEQYPQPHPKQRILAALYDIKSLEAVKEAETIIQTHPIEVTFSDAVHALDEIPAKEKFEEMEMIEQLNERFREKGDCGGFENG